MFEKELAPGRRLMYGRIPPVLSVETLWITSAQELSRSLWFKSCYWQDNKNPPPHLVNSLHCKFQSPGCSAARVPKHSSRAASHLLPGPVDHSSRVKGSLPHKKDAFHLRPPFQRWVKGRRPDCRCKAVLQPCRPSQGNLVGALLGDVVFCRA